MENDETTIHITWGIYVKGVNHADLTEKERLCRRVARRILGITDQPVEVWQDTNIKPAAGRPGRDAMLRAAQQKDFSILVTPAPHHISRVAAEYVRITRTLIENGIVIHFADGTTQNRHETERPRYTLYRRVSSAAQGVDTKRPMGRDIRSQQAAAHTRSGPFGYPNGPAKKVKRLLRIRRMASDGLTPRKIARVLNGEGIPTPGGKVWTAPAVRRALRASSDTKTDRAAFRRVQERLERARRKQNTPSGSARRGTGGHDKPLLRDLLRCGVCDEPMAIISAKGRRFYRCRNAGPGINPPEYCEARAIGAEDLDQEVWTQVREMVNDPAGALEAHRGEGEPVEEAERRIAEYCRRMALDLDTLDPKGKRELLLALGMTATAEMAEDGTRITVRFDIRSDGPPEPVY